MKQLDEQVFVSPQIQPDDIAEIAEEGFACVICNRPDGEEPGQPNFAEISAAAEAAGMTALYLPMSGRDDAFAIAADFLKAMNETDGKIFAYCRSGARCEIAWMAAQSAPTA